MDKDIAMALQALYLKGIEMYKDLDTNLSPVTRVRLLGEAIQGWNRCQRVLDGKRTT